MIVLNGKVYTDLDSVIAEEDIIQHFQVYTFPIEESVRVEAGKIIFWEAHYFRMMASLRILADGNSHDVHYGIFRRTSFVTS